MMAADNFFEGVEKLLEIWFKSSKDSDGDLRRISQSTWEKVLEAVECQIIGSIKSSCQVAYILSESSLFVSKERVILKTCGTTLCLQSLEQIIVLAKTECDLDVVADCFYSRRKFKNPEQQPFPHTTFENEVVFLENILPGGSAYCLGSLTDSCWYLWTLNSSKNPSFVGVNRPDQTLEILMTDLDPEVMTNFYKNHPVTGKLQTSEEVTKNTGIDKLIPNSNIDSFLFSPCGYSMNGILGNEKYWTIHITPEKTFSYVSFETNVDRQNYDQLIQDVLKTFKPNNFCLTLFWNKDSLVDSEPWVKGQGPKVFGFKRLNTQLAHMENYTLFFSDYEHK